jgi:leader peptidase (prepilin peptidase)/N-methyltransferase
MSETALYAILAGILGLLIGSFLNVCIYRWTRDLSVVKPRSACPECNHPIAWYDNIPLVSFVVLGGRCRKCRTRIPWTYPAVEFLTALFFCYFVAIQGLDLAAAKDCLFAAIMIGLIFSDLDTRLLPDEFTVGGLVAGLAISLIVPLPSTVFGLMAEMAGLHPGARAISFGEALVGALLPSSAMWLLGWVFERVRHKEYLGFGDVKMIAMMGAFLGTSGVIVTLLFGSLLGSVGGLAYLKITRKDPATYYLPFATFLGGAALLVVAAHGGITNWYEQLLR